MSSIFDTFQGLPIHPLIVHLVVVVLPIATFSTIISVYSSRFRKGYAFASVIGVFVGTAAAFVAKQSGEALGDRVGLPRKHSDYGNILTYVALAFLIVVLLWYRKWRRARSNRINALGFLLTVLGIAVLVLTYLAGHTGATAVWQKKISITSQP